MKEIDKILGLPTTSIQTPTAQPVSQSANTSNVITVDSKDIMVKDDKTIQILNVEEQLKKNEENKIDADFNEARDYIKNSLEVTKDAVEKIIILAKETEKHQYFDVLNKFLNTMSTNSKDLLELYDKKNKAKTIKAQPNSNQINNSTVTNINNAVFTGTPSELKKMIESKKNNGN